MFSGLQNSAERIQSNPKGRKESPSDDSSTAESQSNRKQSPIPKTGKRKSRTRASLSEMNKPATDGETSEAESSCCSVSEPQNSILRITRRRQILVACTPVSSVRKRLKITSISESQTEEEVSEAESHASGISRIVPSTRTRSKAKSLTDPSQELHSEAISDAESSCSEISTFSGIATRTTRSMQRKLQAQTEEKDTKIIPGNEKQMINTSMNSDTRQTSCLQARSLSRINKPNFSNEICNDIDNDSFHGKSGKKPTVQKCQRLNIKERQANVAPLKEITKQNCKSLDEEAEGMIDKGKEINEKNSELSFPELQDAGLQQLISQRHSTPQNNKTTSKPSSLNSEAIMKSLAQTFAVVEIDRWTEERKSTVKRSDFTSSDGGGSDEEECTIIADSEDMNEERDVDFECDTKLDKSELNTSQDDSVLLLLSSDESQQSENSEIEEDTVCFVENSVQRGSLHGDSENKLCDNALFVIDTTPGLSADKKFYLDGEDKASEVAIEEEKEEEDEKSEEPSDQDENEDEFSDEDDLLSGTTSKL